MDVFSNLLYLLVIGVLVLPSEGNIGSPGSTLGPATSENPSTAGPTTENPTTAGATTEAPIVPGPGKLILCYSICSDKMSLG
jgi:hypothetical protein